MNGVFFLQKKENIFFFYLIKVTQMIFLQENGIYIFFFFPVHVTL